MLRTMLFRGREFAADFLDGIPMAPLAQCIARQLRDPANEDKVGPVGVGLRLDTICADETCKVIIAKKRPHTSSWREEALEVGHEIVAVDGLPVNGMRASQVENLLRGSHRPIGGVGITLQLRDGACVVKYMETNSPCYLCKKIEVGHELATVDGTHVAGLTLSQVTNMICGEPHTQVVLGLVDPVRRWIRTAALTRVPLSEQDAALFLDACLRTGVEQARAPYSPILSHNDTTKRSSSSGALQNLFRDSDDDSCIVLNRVPSSGPSKGTPLGGRPSGPGEIDRHTRHREKLGKYFAVRAGRGDTSPAWLQECDKEKHRITSPRAHGTCSRTPSPVLKRGSRKGKQGGSSPPSPLRIATKQKLSSGASPKVAGKGDVTSPTRILEESAAPRTEAGRGRGDMSVVGFNWDIVRATEVQFDAEVLGENQTHVMREVLGENQTHVMRERGVSVEEDDYVQWMQSDEYASMNNSGGSNEGDAELIPLFGVPPRTVEETGDKGWNNNPAVNSPLRSCAYVKDCDAEKGTLSSYEVFGNLPEAGVCVESVTEVLQKGGNHSSQTARAGCNAMYRSKSADSKLGCVVSPLRSALKAPGRSYSSGTRRSVSFEDMST